MHQYYSVLKKSLLFLNFENAEIELVLIALSAHLKQYCKNEVIRLSEKKVTEIGVIVEGAVFLTKTDYKGNRTILTELFKGSTFGEDLSFSEADNSPISVVAAKNSCIVLLSSDKIIENDSLPCELHKRLMANLVRLLAEKNILLQIKNDILSQKTTREKILLYLDYESKTAKSKTLSIDFSREQLADFLSVNSSALSRELGQMQKEGILTFKKNRFRLSAD